MTSNQANVIENGGDPKVTVEESDKLEMPPNAKFQYSYKLAIGPHLDCRIVMSWA